MTGDLESTIQLIQFIVRVLPIDGDDRSSWIFSIAPVRSMIVAGGSTDDFIEYQAMRGTSFSVPNRPRSLLDVSGGETKV